MTEQATYTLADVAQRLGVSQPTIVRQTKSGAFPAGIKIGSQWRWRIKDVEAFIAGEWVRED